MGSRELGVKRFLKEKANSPRTAAPLFWMRLNQIATGSGTSTSSIAGRSISLYPVNLEVTLVLKSAREGKYAQRTTLEEEAEDGSVPHGPVLYFGELIGHASPVASINEPKYADYPALVLKRIPSINKPVPRMDKIYYESLGISVYIWPHLKRINLEFAHLARILYGLTFLLNWWGIDCFIAATQQGPGEWWFYWLWLPHPPGPRRVSFGTVLQAQGDVDGWQWGRPSICWHTCPHVVSRLNPFGQPSCLPYSGRRSPASLARPGPRDNPSKGFRGRWTSC